MPLSISQKLAATVAISVGVSGILTGAVALGQDYTRYVESRRDSLLASASAFAAAVAHPVALGNAEQTFEALRGIGDVENFVQASVTDRQGRVLSTVGKSARLDSDATVAQDAGKGSFFGLLRSRTLQIDVDVTDAGVEVGRLVVLSEAGDLLPGLLRSGLMSLTGTMLALTIGLAFATRVQAAIIRPLKSLTEAMTRVRSSSDFTAELPERGGDEFGVLVSGYNAMLANIRERDARLQSHRDRLEQDVANRTHDLAIARDEAERANAAKSDFLATMSHEIRTPMSGMLVMAELLESDDLPPRARRYAEVISQSGQALLAIINDILDLAKIEAGKMHLEEGEVDVEALVGTVLNLFYARAREKNLDLAARIAPDVPALVRGDPVRLNQVVNNLVGNALKFTEHGTVTVEIAAVVSPRAGLRITVTDTGIGIPSGKLGEIFDAFGQADQSTTRRFGGTGLGLAISNRLVQAMDGTIAVTSAVGAGSSFVVEIPAQTLQPAVPWPHLPAGSGPVEAYVAIVGPVTRVAVAGCLKDAGYRVEAGPGLSRLDARIGLVIADASVLPASGPRLQSDYVVALAEPDQADFAALDAMADLVVTRPVLRADLRRLLEQATRGEPLTGAARARQTKTLPRFPAARVLAADDSAVNQEVLAEALRRFGIVPVLVNNGAEALEAMEQQRFDLVLMDGSMPVLDGFEACRRRRRIELETASPRLPIVALTAHVMGAGAEAWVAAGMDGMLTKPFTIDGLARVLQTHLGGDLVEAPRQAEQPADAAGDVPLLDGAVLAEIGRVGEAANQGFAQRIFSLYRQHAPVAVEQVFEAMAAADAAAVASAAHALKSMSRNVGAARVGLYSEEIERAAADGTMETSAATRLRDALASTLAALDDHVPASTEAPKLERVG